MRRIILLRDSNGKIIDRINTGKNWFSWSWLIFWICVFFPGAIVYLLIKLGDRKE